VVVGFHGLVPLMDDGINDNVKDGWGHDVSLCDTLFGWEGFTKDTLLSTDDGVGVPEVK